MKLAFGNLDKTTQVKASKKTLIPFMASKKKSNLSTSDYQTYKLQNSPKDDKSQVHLLKVRIYKVGTPKKRLQFIEGIKWGIKGQEIIDDDTAYTLVKSLLHRDSLQNFQNKEKKHTTQSSEGFTSCLNAVTEHVFPTKAYKMQK
eukprot:13077060-Ditylum_brightwellii.AAC.1